MTKQTIGKDRSYELKKLKAECVAEENAKYLLSQKFRCCGSVAATPGNTGLKATKSEVHILIVGNEEDTKALQEQFKSTRSYKKTKSFTSTQKVYDYLKESKFSSNSIIILILITPADENTSVINAELEGVSKIKADDPSLDVMLLSSGPSSSAVDFVLQKGNDVLGKIVSNLTWAIREQERIRRQVESKKFIKTAIIIFIVFFVVVFAIDLVTGFMDRASGTAFPKGVLGIIPIPAP